jgi:crotonobetainyl-CoA:carnitine CoA-transferase CaiB-like acyl-CoA transferase
MADEMAALPGAFDKVRVLDFTTVMSGPFTTRMLADLGAEVVKVESLDGDQVRARPPLRDGASAYFGHLNAGKQSIVLNLKSPEAIRIVKALLPRFDVVVENFRPGVMKRLGLNYETLAAINPRLIYCAISGFGQSGPRSQEPAYAPVVHALSGFDMVNLDYQDGAMDRPASTGIFIADVLGGTHAFGAIAAALYQRERTGEGQMIDLSMLEAMAGMLVFELQKAQNAAPRRPLYTPIRTRDGFLVVAPTSARNFEQLADAVDHPEWRDDPRFSTVAARNANWAALLAETERWTLERSAIDAERILSERGVPCARYREVDELLDDTQLAARDFFKTVTDGGGSYKVPNPPFRMSGSRVEARDRISTLGEHGDALLREELSMTDAEIARLRAAGAIG